MKTMKQRALGLPALALAATLALPALAAAGIQPLGEEHPYQVRVRAPVRTRVVMGHAGRGYLGVQLLDLTEELRDFYGAPQDAGTLVSRVAEDSPAAAAGFEVGDVITGVAGERTESSREVMRAVGGLEPEDEVAVEVIRAGAPLTLNATVGEREGGVWFSRDFDMPGRLGTPDLLPFVKGVKGGCGPVPGSRWKVPSRGDGDARWLGVSETGGRGSDLPRRWETRRRVGGCSPSAAERSAFPTRSTGSL